MNFDIYIPDIDIANYLDRQGYKIISARMLLKKKFGFKNTVEMKEKLKVADSFLRAKLAYKDKQELAYICVEMGGLIQILLDQKQRSKLVWRDKANVSFLNRSAYLDNVYLDNGYALNFYYGDHQKNYHKTVGDFKIKTVFKEIFKEQYKNITNIERIQLW